MTVQVTISCGNAIKVNISQPSKESKGLKRLLQDIKSTEVAKDEN